MDKMKINTKVIMSGVWEIVDVLVTLIKGVLIIGGAVASASADVVLGALTLALLLVNTEGTIPSVKYAPIMISMGASGIQLILWQIIQNKGGVKKIWQGDIAIKIAFIATFLMKFADDAMDVTIVNHLMAGSILLTSLGPTLFRGLQVTVMFIVWVLTGFSEIFVVNALELLKDVKNLEDIRHIRHPQDSSQKPRYQPQNTSNHIPPFVLDKKTREYFADKRK